MRARARRSPPGCRELPGCEILNDVVLNQVLLRFEDDETTDAVVAAVQASGEAWMGGTVWDDRRAIRISVSNWQTSDGRRRADDRRVHRGAHALRGSGSAALDRTPRH